MTMAEARALIEDLTQWASVPALSVAEVDRLLSRARITDANGYEPGAVGYVDTYSLASVNGSVAMGWEMKAGKAAGAYDVKAGDAEAKLSQQEPALAGRARRYRAAGGIGSITLTTAIAEAGS